MKQKKYEPKEISFDRTRGHITVEAMVNTTIPATFIVDTGAPTVLLTNQVARKLGIDFNKVTRETILFSGVADTEEPIAAGMIILESVSIGDVEAKGVPAIVLLDDGAAVDIKDGLLGMSFLERFAFQVDSKNRKLILEKKGSE